MVRRMTGASWRNSTVSRSSQTSGVPSSETDYRPEPWRTGTGDCTGDAGRTARSGHHFDSSSARNFETNRREPESDPYGSGSVDRQSMGALGNWSSRYRGTR